MAPRSRGLPRRRAHRHHGDQLAAEARQAVGKEGHAEQQGDAEDDVAVLSEHAGLLHHDADDRRAEDRAGEGAHAAEVDHPNVGGLTKPFMWASRLPAAPAIAEPNSSSVTRMPVTPTPEVRQAVSFSRMARSAPPNGECSNRWISPYSMTRAVSRSHAYAAGCSSVQPSRLAAGMPRNPMGPLVTADHWL